MNLDVDAIDLDEMKQDTEAHLSPHDAARLGLKVDVEAADDVDPEWVVR